MMLTKEKAHWDRWLGLRTGRRRQEILSLIMLGKTGIILRGIPWSARNRMLSHSGVEKSEFIALSS